MLPSWTEAASLVRKLWHRHRHKKPLLIHRDMLWGGGRTFNYLYIIAWAMWVRWKLNETEAGKRRNLPVINRTNTLTVSTERVWKSLVKKERDKQSMSDKGQRLSGWFLFHSFRVSDASFSRKIRKQSKRTRTKGEVGIGEVSGLHVWWATNTFWRALATRFHHIIHPNVLRPKETEAIQATKR